jgi:hypothetical protein
MQTAAFPPATLDVKDGRRKQRKNPFWMLFLFFLPTR